MIKTNLIFLLSLPIMIMAIKENEIIKISLSDAGKKGRHTRISWYQEILDLTGRQNIR